MTHRKYLKEKKRIVVKVGTSTLAYENGTINLQRMERLAMVLSDLQNSGKEVILVSSGAVGVGLGMIGLEERPTDLVKKQALAAIGQVGQNNLGCALGHRMQVGRQGFGLVAVPVALVGVGEIAFQIAE